jgi:sulfite reductase (NADPH) flavoprotein alpha-component
MHDVSPEVDSLLGMYEIGAMRRLNFKGVTGVAVSREGLTVVSVDDLFRSWVRYLYLTTEIENALTNDYSVYDQPLTEGEVVGELTPMRVHLMIEAHCRFSRTVIDALTGQNLENLWLTSIGLLRTEGHVLWMEQQINGLRDNYRGLESTDEVLQGMLDRALISDENRKSHLSAVVKLCEQLAANDAALVRECKEAARSAVREFEMFEADVSAQGDDQIISALKRIPTGLRRYYEATTQSLPEAQMGFVDRTYSAPRTPPVNAPGHGGRVSHRTSPSDDKSD